LFDISDQLKELLKIQFDAVNFHLKGIYKNLSAEFGDYYAIGTYCSIFADDPLIKLTYQKIAGEI